MEEYFSMLDCNSHWMYGKEVIAITLTRDWFGFIINSYNPAFQTSVLHSSEQRLVKNMNQPLENCRVT